jgi:hypothetical protein
MQMIGAAALVGLAGMYYYMYRDDRRQVQRRNEGRWSSRCSFWDVAHAETGSFPSPLWHSKQKDVIEVPQSIARGGTERKRTFFGERVVMNSCVLIILLVLLS